MANLNRNFIKGIMNKDVDSRLIPEGEYRHAENISVLHSEGSDVGTVQNFPSNRRLTNLDLGTNPVEIGKFEDNKNLKLYWLVASDTGSFLIEYDTKNMVASFVIADTRIGNARVFNLNKNFLCTGINKIYNEDENKDLFLMTDNYMNPLCFNIARMKSLGANNFEKEDIWMIKKPPRFAPLTALINTGSEENYLNENFVSFSYRYQYLDGEYSALSFYTNYKFSPKKFDLDYETFENKGMINSFNAVRLTFNTGDKRVTNIQLVAKKSNSNALYIIETFNKKNEGYGDNENRSYVFSNNKIYIPLPERELGRAFDNVPRLAQSQTVIENIAVYGNYLEQWDLIDKNNNPTALSFTLSTIQKPMNGTALQTDLLTVSAPGDVLKIMFTGTLLKKDSKISLSIFLNDITYNLGDYDESLDFILNQDYLNAGALAQDADFITYIQDVLSNNFNSSYNTTPPANSVISTRTGFSILSYTATSISIKSPTITYLIDDTPANPSDNPANTRIEVSRFGFNGTIVDFYTIQTSASAKSNRSYEVGFVYFEEFNRSTTVQTIPKNTIFIPCSASVSKNSIKVRIDKQSLAPMFADRYKVVVKAQRASYQTLYSTIFFEDGLYRWVKLEGENKDKVKEGDTLIVKKDINRSISDLIKIQVLEIKPQEKNFITDNNDEDGVAIYEPSGLYMKIRPNGFNMDYSPDEFIYDEGGARRANDRPYIRLEKLSRKIDGVIVDLFIPQGSIITIKLVSSGRGRGNKTFDKTYIVQNDYINFKAWFDDVITLPLSILENADEKYTQVSVVRGLPDGDNGFILDPAGYLFLVATGITPGNGNTRGGFLDGSLSIRLVDGFCIFETEPKSIDEEIFYQSEQTFSIVNGYHQGNLVNQSLTTDAELELDFFNCYCQGNGAESYIVKDAFNKNFLNVDLRPSAVSVEKYKAIRKFADLTNSEPYVESGNINGINVFNLSTTNFRELDKQYGSIQKLASRDNDIVVLREFKASKVLFKKEYLYNADGTSNLAVIDNILGSEVTYLGDNGIGKSPESYAENDYQIFYANPNNGTIIRLSIDGTTEIINGMKDYFRDLFRTKPLAKKIGGYDPHTEQFYISTSEEPDQILKLTCGNTILKEGQEGSFTYQLKLNDVIGNITLLYNISQGNATIVANFNGVDTVLSNVTGIGTMIIVRNTLLNDLLTVNITQVGSALLNYEISNVCPIGNPLKIISIVLNDDNEIGQTISNEFSWGISPNFDREILFGPNPQFEIEQGVSGQGKFPSNSSIITLRSVKGSLSSGFFKTEECNKLGYLVSNTLFTELNVNTILNSATFLSSSQVTEGTNDVHFGSFLFNRLNTEILYLIWDYRNTLPIANGDFILIDDGSTVINIDVLTNDIYIGTPILTIITNPINGTVIVDINNTITYTKTNLPAISDEFTYLLSNGVCTSSGIVRLIFGDGLDPLLNYNVINLHRNVSDGPLACAISGVNAVTKYIDTLNFNAASKLFNDVNGLSYATVGWYTNGSISRHWNGLVFDDLINCG